METHTEPDSPLSTPVDHPHDMSMDEYPARHSQDVFSQISFSRLRSVRTIFRLCDQDCDGRLSEQEMHTFARALAFQGTRAQWADEYRLLCRDNPANPMI